MIRYQNVTVLDDIICAAHSNIPPCCRNNFEGGMTAEFWSEMMGDDWKDGSNWVNCHFLPCPDCLISFVEGKSLLPLIKPCDCEKVFVFHGELKYDFQIPYDDNRKVIMREPIMMIE